MEPLPNTTLYRTTRPLTWDGVEYPEGTCVHVLIRQLNIRGGDVLRGLVESHTQAGWFRPVSVRPADAIRVL